jgi:hypothetical protein
MYVCRFVKNGKEKFDPVLKYDPMKAPHIQDPGNK